MSGYKVWFGLVQLGSVLVWFCGRYQYEYPLVFSDELKQTQWSSLGKPQREQQKIETDKLRVRYVERHLICEGKSGPPGGCARGGPHDNYYVGTVLFGRFPGPPGRSVYHRWNRGFRSPSLPPSRWFSLSMLEALN